MAFMKCDAEFGPSGISSVAEWEALIASGDIIITRQVLGEKTEGSPTTLRVASCLPEIVTGRTQTINFQDYNADDENYTHYDMWISLQENYGALIFFYITCDELVYGPFANGTFVLDVDDIRPQTSEEPMYIGGSVTINKKLMTKPVKVAGILDIIP